MALLFEVDSWHSFDVGTQNRKIQFLGTMQELWSSDSYLSWCFENFLQKKPHGPRVEGQEERGTAIVVQASVPLSEMFGYVTDLRSFTQGRGTYTMQFDRYEQVPKSIKEEIIKKNNSNN